MATKTIVMPRNSSTGRIVTKEYAKAHPKTTEIEQRKVTVPAAPRKK